MSWEPVDKLWTKTQQLTITSLRNKHFSITLVVKLELNFDQQLNNQTVPSTKKWSQYLNTTKILCNTWIDLKYTSKKEEKNNSYESNEINFQMIYKKPHTNNQLEWSTTIAGCIIKRKTKELRMIIWRHFMIYIKVSISSKNGC